jgi:hypothetical protein
MKIGRLRSPYPWEIDDMRYYEIDAPLFPVMPRPLQERLRPGLLHALWRWVARGAMHRDAEVALSRQTGARI